MPSKRKKTPPPAPRKPRPVEPSVTPPPTQTELDRERAAGEGMTDPPREAPNRRERTSVPPGGGRVKAAATGGFGPAGSEARGA